MYRGLRVQNQADSIINLRTAHASSHRSSACEFWIIAKCACWGQCMPSDTDDYGNTAIRDWWVLWRKLPELRATRHLHRGVVRYLGDEYLELSHMANGISFFIYHVRYYDVWSKFWLSRKLSNSHGHCLTNPWEGRREFQNTTKISSTDPFDHD